VLLSAVLDSAEEGFLVVDFSGRILTYNDRYARIWNLARTTLDSRDERAVLAGALHQIEDAADFLALIHDLHNRREAESYGTIRFNDGRIVDRYTRPIRVKGEAVARLWSFRDITERVKTSSMLSESEERFRIFADTAAYGILMHQGGSFIYANDAAAAISGYAIHELLEMPYWEVTTSPLRDALRRRGEDRIAGRLTRAERYELPIVTKAGQIRATEVGVSNVRLGGKPTVVATVVDVSERKAAEARAIHYASHDRLTGLPNRNLFRDELAKAIEIARPSGGLVSVVLVGVDRFKAANSLGHRAGDTVLLEVARRLTEVAGETSCVARMGGDEFGILVPGDDPLRDPIGIAEDAASLLRDPYPIGDGTELFLSGSVGLAQFPAAGQDAGALLRHADIALRQAKERGRDQVQAYEPSMSVDADQQLALNRLLHRSLRNGFFFLEFQPIATAAELEIQGFEALLRSRDESGRRLAPEQIIPMAEATGLVVPIGGVVLRGALQAAQAIRAATERSIRVGVNASATQLRHPRFVADILKSLDETGAPAKALAVEVTETNALTDLDSTRRVLAELQERGVSIALDDFGTGFASLDLLRNLPLDLVKIDRSFVRSVETDPAQAAIASSTIALAHKLGLRVVAEGVETEGQRDFLLREGCDFIQGYWLARPMALADSLSWIASR
jgi:diguanylate cyclase (GGDEF)-like protein/PAS domain S-box-containing protein